jgi:RNA polymerase sigma-70 factor (ECF subfamily)
LAGRERSEELRRLLDCLGRLDPEQRQLMLLAYYNGLSREQLASRLGRPVNTIKTWLRRSILAVRECLGS